MDVALGPWDAQGWVLMVGNYVLAAAPKGKPTAAQFADLREAGMPEVVEYAPASAAA